jgi:hypothetical protein
LFREGIRMAKVEVGLDGDVTQGRNVARLVAKVRSEPDEGTEELLDWIGSYAEGEDTQITLKEFKVVYNRNKKRVGGKLEWIEKMLSRWDFDVVVPGAIEEDGFRLLKLGVSAASKTLLAYMKSVLKGIMLA